MPTPVQKVPTNPLTALPIEALRSRRSLKWRRFGPDVLPLWLAEMDVALAEPIAGALTAAVARSDTGYANRGRLPEAFAGYADRTWGWAPDPGHMLVVGDAVSGLIEVVKAVTSPGDAVLVDTPAYPPFFWLVHAVGRRVVPRPLGRTDDGSPTLDLDSLDHALSAPDVTAYLLCNPHNPTGRVHTPVELAAVAELAERHRVRLLVDEIHAPLVHAGWRHTPIATVDAAAAAEAIVVTSASKAWNLPGLKTALVVAAGDAAWPSIAGISAEATFGASLFGILAGGAAYDHGEAWLASLLAGLGENRDLVGRLLGEHLPTARWSPPQATYLAWLDLRATGLGDDPARALLERGRVALSNGPAFGPPGAGHARLNFATSPTVLTEAVRRMGVVASGGWPR